MRLQYQFGERKIGIKIPMSILVCPACSSEIGLTELIERKGYIGCVNCAK